MSTDSKVLKLTGNDIVDLALPETSDKAGDNRYIDRVCAGKERDFISSASDRKTALWMIWSAKEAAFKIVGKLHPKLGFSPRKYFVDCLPFDALRKNKTAVGTVGYGHYLISVWWSITGDYVHCIAAWSNRSSFAENLRSIVWNADDRCPALTNQHFSLREMLSIRSKESCRARIITKKLLSDCGVKNVEIVRDLIGEKLGAPYVLQNDRRCEKYDVSMSHHGRFAAASVLL